MEYQAACLAKNAPNSGFLAKILKKDPLVLLKNESVMRKNHSRAVCRPKRKRDLL
jgi:hypothetical protein